MKRLDTPLLTPIYLATDENEPLPETDSAYYVLSASGLFQCRRHPFYTSCVPSPRWPSELAAWKPSFVPRFPPLDAELLETLVGFCDWAYRDRAAEAVALLAYDRETGRVQPIVPLQQAISVRSYSGRAHPDRVQYTDPSDLPKRLIVFSTLHSHGDAAPYASATDCDDERWLNGLHIVVGRLDDEPPQWHVEAAVDGTRFKLEAKDIVGAYRRRRQRFPAHWTKRHSVVYQGYQPPSVSSGSSYGSHGGYASYGGSAQRNGGKHGYR